MMPIPLIRILFVVLPFLFVVGPAAAQPAYTEPEYAVRTEADQLVGLAEDYQGLPVPILLDLYKPVSDDNCLRPVLLMIHGGAWYAGTRRDPEIVRIAGEMASRGYLVASLEYRLGHHKLESYTQFAACPMDRCVYVSDTAEIYRAVYRGVQDAWSALRYLSSRSKADSSDMANVFVGGVSAGGFVAMQTVLWADPGVRPPEAGSLTDAPVTDDELRQCLTRPDFKNRPDLGPATGSLWPEEPTPVIRGLANFYGGVFRTADLTGFKDMPLYMYHQSNDLIVHCGRAETLSPIYVHCLNPLNLCDRDLRMPMASGSCDIIDAIDRANIPVDIFDDIQQNGPPNGLACLADPPTHSILNIPRRCASLAGHFAGYIEASGNRPDINCERITAVRSPGSETIRLRCFPNPFTDILTVALPNAGAWTLRVGDMDGRQFFTKKMNCHADKLQVQLELGDLPPGVYWLQGESGESRYYSRIVRIH